MAKAEYFDLCNFENLNEILVPPELVFLEGYDESISFELFSLMGNTTHKTKSFLI